MDPSVSYELVRAMADYCSVRHEVRTQLEGRVVGADVAPRLGQDAAHDGPSALNLIPEAELAHSWVRSVRLIVGEEPHAQPNHAT